jgi:hypothetical protein
MLRAELRLLRCRYDSGAVSPGVYAVIRAMEIEIGWLEHERNAWRKRDAVGSLE